MWHPSLHANFPDEYVRQWLACVSGMPYADTHTLQRPTLLSCVHAKRHGGAGAQTRAQQIVRGRPRSQPSDASRFVGKEMGRTGVDLHLEVPDTRLFNHDFTALAGHACGGPADIPRCPRRNDLGDILGVRGAGKKVVGIIQGQETLWMMCCLKDARRVGDVYRRIHRCVQNQQRLSKGAYPLPLVVLGQILDEAAANAERLLTGFTPASP